MATFLLSERFQRRGADYCVTVVCWEEAAGLGFVLHRLSGFAKCDWSLKRISEL